MQETDQAAASEHTLIQLMAQQERCCVLHQQPGACPTAILVGEAFPIVMCAQDIHAAMLVSGLARSADWALGTMPYWTKCSEVLARHSWLSDVDGG